MRWEDNAGSLHKDKSMEHVLASVDVVGILGELSRTEKLEKTLVMCSGSANVTVACLLYASVDRDEGDGGNSGSREDIVPLQDTES